MRAHTHTHTVGLLLPSLLGLLSSCRLVGANKGQEAWASSPAPSPASALSPGEGWN